MCFQHNFNSNENAMQSILKAVELMCNCTFDASIWLEWSNILNCGRGGRMFDLEPRGF